METIDWRRAGLDAACREAGEAGKFVLLDFFSPT
jgi:hypothetical protein